MSPAFIVYFPVCAILLSSIAVISPSIFITFKPAIMPLLSLVMFSMGMTLTWQHFKKALKRPFVIVIALFIQYSLMPLFAFLIALMLNLPRELMIGLMLVGCSSGGTASNVICYLARGDVALSIIMTMVSTLCAVIFMPFLAYLYLHQTVNVPIEDMMQTLLTIVLLPVLTGTAINSLFGAKLAGIQRFYPVLSAFCIILIIAIITGINHANLLNLTWHTTLAVAMHNSLGLLAGYFIARLFGYDETICRTLSIEVGMQNSGLSVALAVKYFNTVAALPGAVFSIWHNISGSMLAAYWRKSAVSTNH